MKIHVLEPSELSIYDELARRHGTLFNGSDWLSLFGEKVRVLGIFDNGGKMIGGMSFYQECRLGLNILRCAPFTPVSGPFLEVTAQHPIAILEARREALECVCEYLGRQSAALIMLSLDRRIEDALPFFWHGYKVIPKYTYLIDLAVSLEQIGQNMSAERRKNIAKAERDGLTVRATTDMEVIQELVLATFGRQHKSVNQTVLEAILSRYAKPSNSFAFTTYRKATPIATCFVVHDTQTAYYLLGGYKAEERHHGAGVMAMFEAIKHSQEIGLKTFDFEGSVIPAVERYFRGFGGQLTSYLTVNKAWLPVEIALKFMKRNIF
ncbi:MAG: GNAT family N-acetyltransferase [Candidatus Omnitrophota bacterium]|jgi:hypothetical protein